MTKEIGPNDRVRIRAAGADILQDYGTQGVSVEPRITPQMLYARGVYVGLEGVVTSTARAAITRLGKLTVGAVAFVRPEGTEGSFPYTGGELELLDDATL